MQFLFFERKVRLIPQRVLLAIMGFLAITNAYTLRLVLSLAITEMVNKTTSGNNTFDAAECPADDSYIEDKEVIIFV